MNEIIKNIQFIDDLYSLIYFIEEKEKITRNKLKIQIKRLILKYKDINKNINNGLLTRNKNGKIINLRQEKS